MVCGEVCGEGRCRGRARLRRRRSRDACVQPAVRHRTTASAANIGGAGFGQVASPHVLPILITFLVIMVGITAVYFVGSQAPKKSRTKPGRSGKDVARRSRRHHAPDRPRNRSRFRETPGWLRKLPLILVILAVVSLVIALAQFRVARSKATPMIALVIRRVQLDGRHRRIAEPAARLRESAAQAFLHSCPPEFAVSLVSFADEPKVLVAPTTDHTRSPTRSATCPRGQGTVIGDGLRPALDAIETYQEGSQDRSGRHRAACPTGHDTGARSRRWTRRPRRRPIAMSPCTRLSSGHAKQGSGGATPICSTRSRRRRARYRRPPRPPSELSSVYEQLGLAAVVPAEDQQLGPAVRVPGDRAGGRRGGDPPAHDAAAVLGVGLRVRLSDVGDRRGGRAHQVRGGDVEVHAVCAAPDRDGVADRADRGVGDHRPGVARRRTV